MLRLLAYTLPLISLTSAIPIYPSEVAQTLQSRDAVSTLQDEDAASSKVESWSPRSKKLRARQNEPPTVTITEAINTEVITATVTETLNFIDPALRTAVAFETVYNPPQRLARQVGRVSSTLEPGSYLTNSPRDSAAPTPSILRDQARFRRQAEGNGGDNSSPDNDGTVTVTVTDSTTVTTSIRITTFTTVTQAPSATTTETITTTVIGSPPEEEEGDEEDPEPTPPPVDDEEEEGNDEEEESSDAPEGTASDPSPSQTDDAGETNPSGSSASSPQPSSTEATPTPSPSESSATSADASTSDITASPSDSSASDSPSSTGTSSVSESSASGTPAPTDDAMASSTGPFLNRDELGALIAGILILVILIVVLAIMCWSRRRGDVSLLNESDREAGAATPQSPFSALTGRSVAPSLAPLTRPQSTHSRGASPTTDNDVLGRAAVISPGHPRWPTSGQIRIPIKPRPKRRTLSSELSPFGYTFPPIPEHDSDGNGAGFGRSVNNSTVGSRAVSGRLASREGSGNWQRPASISGAWLRYFRSDAPRFLGSSRSQSRSGSDRASVKASQQSSRASSRQGPIAEGSEAPVSPLSPGQFGKAV